MNIVEAYIKFKGQLIIFVSGISGCGKSDLAKKIGRNFNIKIIDQFSYYKKNYNNSSTLPNGIIVSNWDTDDAIDWKRLNHDLNKFKSSGIVISGFSLHPNVLSVVPDYHIHLTISKQNCLLRRRKFLTKHKTKYPEEYKLINSDLDRLKMNQLTFPYYLKSRELSNINKYFNSNKLSQSQIWDSTWNILISFISKYLSWFNQNEFDNWIKNNPDFFSNISDDISTSDSISSSDDDNNNIHPPDEYPDGPIEFLISNDFDS